MWIAKPISALSADEIDAWVTTQDLLRQRGREVPLAQTLTWAHAIRAMGLPAYLILSTDEAVGGIVHADPVRSTEGRLHLECVNGPLLEWSSDESLSRQLATFVTACSKVSRSFGSVSLHPRWQADESDAFLDRIPIDPAQLHHAETIKIPVEVSEQRQREVLSNRMRRTLRVTERSGALLPGHTQWGDWTLESLTSFEQGLRSFSEKAGFFVPPMSWFESLVLKNPFLEKEGIRFHEVQSQILEVTDVVSRTRLLIAVDRSGAHYLQGFDERSPSARAALSTSITAHFRALEELRKLGISEYDLNGFSDPEAAAHPYAGVAQFKGQFGGRKVTYVSPEYRITAD